MKVLLFGENALADALAERIEQAGHALVFGLDDEPVDEIEVVVVADTMPLELYDVFDFSGLSYPADAPMLCSVLGASATEIASWHLLPERTVGFAALPPLATVIELVPARQSSEEAIQQAEAFWRSLGLDPVCVQDGVAGVVPRVVCNLVNEATYALQESVASAEDIDRAMQLGTNWPRGPLAWGDLIGLQTVVEVIDALGREYGTDVYHPAPLLRQMARADERFHGE